ncbi:hypothetical protein V8F44DRAFT_535495 [Aspergillus fumigatus]|uniref:Uncharacterized protein n=1 Tax=Aspergillus fumigatus (strain CBS 144.89 / FGSC A1163 / CEA10) TaxID=451804 RepID=B0XN41_ASPFC|nr:hypothetical protein AFUB_014500 [Aspergillus fumigatus A1163]
MVGMNKRTLTESRTHCCCRYLVVVVVVAPAAVDNVGGACHIQASPLFQLGSINPHSSLIFILILSLTSFYLIHIFILGRH